MLLMKLPDSLLSVGMVQAEAHCILMREAACDGSYTMWSWGFQLKPRTPTEDVFPKASGGSWG